MACPRGACDVSDPQRVDVDGPAQHALVVRAQVLQAGSQAPSMRCSATRDGDSRSICMRSTSATRATGGGTGGYRLTAPACGMAAAASDAAVRKSSAASAVRASARSKARWLNGGSTA